MRRPARPEAIVMGAAAALLAGAAVGAFHEREPAGPSTAMGTMVVIQDFQFGPPELRVPAGETVTWTNADSAEHTVQGDGAAAAMSSTLTEGATYSFTFEEAGTYDYICTIHPSMQGTIVARQA